MAVIPYEQLVELASNLKGWLLVFGIVVIAGTGLIHLLRNAKSKDLKTVFDSIPKEQLDPGALREIIAVTGYKYDELALLPEGDRAAAFTRRT